MNFNNDLKPLNLQINHVSFNYLDYRNTETES